MVIQFFKILIIFIFIYFLIGLVKMIFNIGKAAYSSQQRNNKAAPGPENRPGYTSNKIIELDKDQYKVE